MLAGGSDDAVVAAVTYVAGMTDRFAMASRCPSSAGTGDAAADRRREPELRASADGELASVDPGRTERPRGASASASKASCRLAVGIGDTHRHAVVRRPADVGHERDLAQQRHLEVVGQRLRRRRRRTARSACRRRR